ncbi:N-acetyltransferase family protein [Tropicimonas sp. S265A]|uniref:GNAT family N-acetyltransferase n=1 Tax=Tropicimonas sp. S265A TaxID=3415134 RepID=UPI003C7A5644
MSPLSLSIRPIRAQDVGQWRPLWAAYLEFYETTLPQEVYETSFARLTDPAVTDYHGRIAWEGDTALGLVHFIYHRHGWHVDPVCYLQDLFTVPGARGKGVARGLISEVYAQADRDNAASVYWLTQDFNTRARQLYDQVATVTPFIKYVRSAA